MHLRNKFKYTGQERTKRTSNASKETSSRTALPGSLPHSPDKGQPGNQGSRLNAQPAARQPPPLPAPPAAAPPATLHPSPRFTGPKHRKEASEPSTAILRQPAVAAGSKAAYMVAAASLVRPPQDPPSVPPPLQSVTLPGAGSALPAPPARRSDQTLRQKESNPDRVVLNTLTEIRPPQPS
ncbi:classical arabinogalactan protein 9-like [Delphinapterus leucas]|uniref:Classical arabinogalactan protein 9-like n=1 Tax=Delphinapterus leucas TaxID=9749 RepID=A0A7F8K4F2_DELLE|nr:classical arabinogalactan protein 9-like [Delphinapterus leucas]